MLGRLGTLLAPARLIEHARSLRAFPRFLAQPIVAAVLASGLTALLLAGPPEVVTVKEVRVVERIPGTTKVIRETVYVCDPSLAAKLDNRTKDTSARTGTASFDNETASSVSDPGGGALATGQTANASSGNAVNGQVTDIEASGCAQVNANLTNTCIDCHAETGDASAENDSQVAAGVTGSLPFSSPSPSPEVLDQIAATPYPSASPSSSGTAVLAQYTPNP